MREYHEGDPMIIDLPEPGELLYPSKSLKELYRRKDCLSKQISKLRASISPIELEISEKQVEHDRIERDIDIRIEKNHEEWKKEFIRRTEMRYIPNNETQKAIFFNESKMTEEEAQSLIGCNWTSRDGSEWTEFNIIPSDKAYQVVDYEGTPDEDDEEYEIDPIWYCYQYREGEINYDEGSWDAAAAIDMARSFSIDNKVQAVGLRENYCYREYDIEEEEWNN